MQVPETTRAEAVERVLELRADALDTAGTERVALSGVGGAVLAEPIVAEADSPPCDRATMDGFAVDATVPGPYELLAESVAPEDDPLSMEPGQAVRIATGAPLPSTANAVCKREDATVEDGSLVAAPVGPGDHVHARGTNVAAGEVVYEAGRRLSPKDAALLADLGYDAVPVRERPTAAVLATGTEIHEGRQSDLDSAMLAGLLDAWGADPTHEGTVPDDREVVRNRLDALASDADVVVTSGGTSVGEKDHVVGALADLGEVVVRSVAVRPGKPVAIASLPVHDAVAFAHPGKPVAAHVAATLFLQPFLVGEAPRATVSASLDRAVAVRHEGFEYLVPVTLHEDGAMPLGHVDSVLPIYEETFEPSVLSACTRALAGDGYVLTDTDLAAGETVDVVPSMGTV